MSCGVNLIHLSGNSKRNFVALRPHFYEERGPVPCSNCQSSKRTDGRVVGGHQNGAWVVRQVPTDFRDMHASSGHTLAELLRDLSAKLAQGANSIR